MPLSTKINCVPLNEKNKSIPIVDKGPKIKTKILLVAKETSSVIFSVRSEA